MLKYHFITGLKPLCLDKPAAISIEYFLKQSLEVLGSTKEIELKKLSLLPELNEMGKDLYALSFEKHPTFLKLCSFWNAVFPDEPLEKTNLDAIKRSYWRMLIASSKSAFIREYAQEAYNFYDFLTNVHRKNNYSNIKPYLADPIQLHEYVQDFLWQTIEKLTPTDPFNEDQVFAYFLKLIMNNQHQSYSDSKGQSLLEDIKNAALYLGFSHARS